MNFAEYFNELCKKKGVKISDLYMNNALGKSFVYYMRKGTKSVDETINNKINSVVDNAADGFMNGLLGVFVGMADSGVDKRNIDMYYGTWYDSNTGKYIYIKEGKDYKIDLSDVGYGKNVSGKFTSSQTIYMGSIGMGIIMNDDGSIYIDTISITGKDPLGGHYVKQ